MLIPEVQRRQQRFVSACCEAAPEELVIQDVRSSSWHVPLDPDEPLQSLREFPQSPLSGLSREEVSMRKLRINLQPVGIRSSLFK